MAYSPLGNFRQEGRNTVTVSASGDSTHAVTFASPFQAAPHVVIWPNAADEATGAAYEATNVTVTGFTLTISASVLVSRDVCIEWTAQEKG